MHRTLVLNVVGLTPDLIGEHTPNLAALARRGSQTSISSVTPAVTCTAQATYVTGLPVSEHGIVANGWYFRDTCDIAFWKQSNKLVQGEKVWEAGKRLNPDFTCAKLFWWYNMYSSADVSVTPRPMYPADGRKLPDVYSSPASIRDELQAEFGQFPLFKFWGPLADIESSEWIGRCAEWVERRYRPTLNLVYLPHLDYNLQRLGPRDSRIGRDLRAVDAVCGRLLKMASADGLRVVVLSEYGISEVTDAVAVNRALRAKGYISIREERGRDLLDAGASRAFAVADHQLCHIYIADPADVPRVRKVVSELDGVEYVLGSEEKRSQQLDHTRAGELVAVAKKDRWFSYYFWEDDRRAPDFARTVDIHRKPGYDPVELFMNPSLGLPKVHAGYRLLQRKLGFRALFDVVGFDTTLVKGSHGRPTRDANCSPILISSEPGLWADEAEASGALFPATEIKQLILSHVFEAEMVAGTERREGVVGRVTA